MLTESSTELTYVFHLYKLHQRVPTILHLSLPASFYLYYCLYHCLVA